MQAKFLQKSRYITWLVEKSESDAGRIAFMAVFSGILQSLVVVIINGAINGLDGEQIGFRYLAMFALCMGGYIYTVHYAITRSVRTAGSIVYKTQQRLVDKMRNAGYLDVETTDKSLIYKNLIESTDIIFEAARALAMALSSVAMLLGSSAYISSLSLPAFLIVVALNTVGVTVYMKVQKKVNANLAASKEEELSFLNFYKHLIEGFAEVKMSRKRSDDLFDNYILKTSRRAQNARLTTENFITRNIIFAQSFFYALIGSMVFLVPQFTDGAESNVGQIAAAVLFILGPLGAIIGAVPLVTKAEYAVKAIEKFEEYLDKAEDHSDTSDEALLAKKPKFKSIELRGVEFQYKEAAENERVFRLGPLDLTIEPNQIVFLLGGNGTGKSTLMKVIAGLYYPKRGEVLVDGRPLDRRDYAHYREMFATIFASFHTFDRPYGIKNASEARVNQLLKEMSLDEVTGFADGQFTSLNLSTGQRKRLALATSILEDKPILLYDEVAADLDPQFRRHFYEAILPGLKAQGKTVIAVSHDDRFFHLADKVVKLDYGKLADNGKA